MESNSSAFSKRRWESLKELAAQGIPWAQRLMIMVDAVVYLKDTAQKMTEKSDEILMGAIDMEHGIDWLTLDW